MRAAALCCGGLWCGGREAHTVAAANYDDDDDDLDGACCCCGGGGLAKCYRHICCPTNDCLDSCCRFGDAEPILLPLSMCCDMEHERVRSCHLTRAALGAAASAAAAVTLTHRHTPSLARLMIISISRLESISWLAMSQPNLRPPSTISGSVQGRYQVERVWPEMRSER